MWITATAVLLPAVTAAALAVSDSAPPQRKAIDSCSSPVSLDANTNVWKSHTLHANSIYREKVEAAVETITDSVLKTKALKVANAGTFLWIESVADIDKIEFTLPNLACDQILGLVIHGLPGPRCAHASSSDIGNISVKADAYQNRFINSIADILEANAGKAFALIIEPKALTFSVLNADLGSCQTVIESYRDGITYALTRLNLPNVIMYIDAGHGGSLGWKSNRERGAEEIARMYRTAGSPSQLRGFATNVAGWNSWDYKPGEFEYDGDAQYNPAQNEKIFVELFGKALDTVGVPNHAVIDTSRNGVIGLRENWTDWCNVNGAGFGVRPSTDTGLDLADSFIWVKPGGESDGTSDPNSFYYDSFCGRPDAFKPSPEVHMWNQAYFTMLLMNAHPPL